jgi:ligand-binding sensor domain-containing protein/signal transduction histidine kinase
MKLRLSLRESNIFREPTDRQGWRLRLFALFSVLFFVCTAHAIDPNRAISQYIRDFWNMENGFPGGQVNSIAQTADGYLWIGTDKGLVRFDGLNFLTIQQPGPAMLPITHVIGLQADREGGLWVRMQGPNVLRYHDGRFQNLLAGLGASEAVVTAMAAGNDGSVLLSTLIHGILRYQEGKLETLAAKKDLPESLVISIAETSDGRVWMGTRDNGLFYVEHGRVASIEEGLPDSKINSLLPTKDGGLWIGTDNGAAMWTGTRISTNDIPSSLHHVQVLTMTKDRDANIWIGTSRGLLRLSAKGVSSLRKPDRLSNIEVPVVFEDREANLWIGNAQGIERFRDSPFVTYSMAEGLPSDSNGPIYIDREDRTWVAPSSGGLYWMKDGKVERVPQFGRDGDVIYSMAGKDDEMWIGRQRGGLTRLRLLGTQASLKTYAKSDGLAQNSVYTVHENPDGAVWAGTLSGGVSKLKDGVLTTYTIADGLASNTVTSIEDGPDGKMWFATSAGLNELWNGHWRTYSLRDGLPSQEVISTLRDSRSILWIGTAEGLAFLDSNRVQTNPDWPGPLHESILGLAEDKNGSLWIATSNHVLRVTLNGLLHGPLSDGDIREYGFADGLHRKEGVRRDRSVIRDRYGRIWFSMSRDLSVVDPNQDAKDAPPAIAHVDGVSADGTPIDLRGPIHIPASHQRILFNYAGLSLAVPEHVQFRYKLDGFDHGWSEPVSTRQAIYTNLGPGPYRFHLIASNSNRQWNGSETTLTFRIEPAYWQSWWFRFCCLLAVAIAGWLLYRLRMRQMAKELSVRFEERLGERMRIAQELHDTLLQGFLSASMQLHIAADYVPTDSPAKPLLGRVLQLMGQVIQEGRNALQGLRSAGGDFHNLEQALSRVPQELAIQQPIAYRVIVDGPSRPLHPIIRDEVYRIGREAIVNAYRHARASSIEVEVEYTASCLQVAVRDNGCGIDPQVLRSGRVGHWGLPGMRERAEGIGAKLRVLSRTAAGTEVELTVPNNIAYQNESGSGRLRWLTKFRLQKVEDNELRGGRNR